MGITVLVARWRPVTYARDSLALAIVTGPGGKQCNLVGSVRPERDAMS